MGNRRTLVGATAFAIAVMGILVAGPGASSAATMRPSPGAIKVESLSSGGQAWFKGPLRGGEHAERVHTTSGCVWQQRGRE